MSLPCTEAVVIAVFWSAKTVPNGWRYTQMLPSLVHRFAPMRCEPMPTCQWIEHRREKLGTDTTDMGFSIVSDLDLLRCAAGAEFKPHLVVVALSLIHI